MATSTHNQSSKEIVGSVDSFVTNLSTNLYNNPDLSDVILEVGAKKYHSHKFLLANFSDVFRTMLVEGRWADAKKPVVTLEETPECVTVFDRFLRFMYCGQIDLDIESVVPLLSLADKYNVHQIKSLCEDYMVRQVENNSNVNGALKWWKFAESFNLGSLSKTCYELICENLDEALVAREWMGLHFDHLCKLLGTTDLYVTDEYELYKGVAKWIQATVTAHSTDEYIAKLLPLIRFPQMKPEQLDSVENSQLCQNNSSKFEKCLYEAFKFHTMGDKTTGKFIGVKFQPRMYEFDMKIQNRLTTLNIWQGNVSNCQSDQYRQYTNFSYTVNAPNKSTESKANQFPSQYRWSLAITSVQFERNKHLIMHFNPNTQHSGMKYRLIITLRVKEAEQAMFGTVLSPGNDTQEGAVKGVLKCSGIVGEFKPHVSSLRSVKSDGDERSEVTTWLKEMYQQLIAKQDTHFAGRGQGGDRRTGPLGQNNVILCAFLYFGEPPQNMSITTKIMVYN
ncbi:BTB/POZ domain-containing protein 17-like [Glandiceps talaboti]